MATFRKRSGAWQVRIQRDGYPALSKTFKLKLEAEAWARNIEAEFDRSIFINHTQAENTTLGELLSRYLAEVNPNKKHPKIEAYRINVWLKHPLADRYLASIRSSDFALWRDSKVKEGKSPSTIKLELAIISHLFNVARTDWGFESLINPVEFIRLPRLPNGRSRRVSDQEIDLIIAATESHELPFIVKIALETAMRRGEIANIMWNDIDLNRRVLKLTDTKNGSDRIVPLSTGCVNVFNQIPRQINGHVFNMTAHAMTYAFIRACKRSGIRDLHLHDIRHECISRLFERGFSLPEVAAISGHRTWAMLKRYTHLKAEDLALKLG